MWNLSSMGRNRARRADEKLPKGVYLSKGRYVLKVKQGGKRREVPLRLDGCLLRTDAPLSVVWKAYEAATGPSDDNTLEWLAKQFLGSPQFQRRSARTRKDYERYHGAIMEVETKAGRFGDFPYAAITTGVIQKYIDKNSHRPVAVNREIAYLSVVFSWAKGRDFVSVNPCSGADKYPEEGRRDTVSVCDEDYYGAILMPCPDYLPLVAELAYLCRLRKAEVLSLKKSDKLDVGIRTHRTKGSKDNIIAWTPRLRAVVAACKRLPGLSVYLIHDKHGQPITASSLDSAWQRLMQKAEANGLSRFPIHDLKAKGITEFKGDKSRSAGHRSEAWRTYDRDIDVVESTR